MDIDILTPDFYNFFEIATILRYFLGFEYYDKLGQAGSFFLSSELVLSGHSHLVKDLGINEQMIIDISFPNIPIREQVLAIDINKGDVLHYETDLLLISLAHALKHSRPPINEINDGFLITHSCKLDWDYFFYKVKENNLERQNYLVCAAIERFYSVSEEYHECCQKNKVSIIFYLFTKLLLALRWPFSRRAHNLLLLYFKFFVKREKANIHKDDSIEVQKALSSTYCSEAQNFSKFLLNKINNRIYFIPLIAFDKYPNIQIPKQIEQEIVFEMICNNIYYIEINESEFILCNNGIMAFTNSFHILDEKMKQLSNDCNDIINILNLNSYTYHKRLIFNDISNLWEFI